MLVWAGRKEWNGTLEMSGVEVIVRLILGEIHHSTLSLSTSIVARVSRVLPISGSNDFDVASRHGLGHDPLSLYFPP